MDDGLAEVNHSPSEVLQATHVFVVAVVDFRLGDWQPTADGALVSRFVELTIVLDQILKGSMEELCGESTTICIEQRGTGTPRVADDYGVWANVELQVGQRLVAFCTSSAPALAELLQPPHCTRLTSTDVLHDLRTCLDLEQRQLPPEEVLKRTAPLLERRSGILSRYLWASYAKAALTEPLLFELFAQLIERPSTSAEARAALFTSAYQALSLMESSPRAQVLRLARAMLTVLAVPQAHGMHENLVRVYLPNLLGLGAGTSVLAASEVLASDNGELRARVLAALTTTLPGADPERRLLRWLAGQQEP